MEKTGGFRILVPGFGLPSLLNTLVDGLSWKILRINTNKDENIYKGESNKRQNRGTTQLLYEIIQNSKKSYL